MAHSALNPAPAGACPDENALGAFVQGQASATQRSQIERHLEQCPECSSVVQLLGEAFVSRAQRIEPGPESSRTQRQPEPSAGQRLGRYRVDHGIGAGGMGLVFSAWDPALERNVALKLLRPELASTEDAKQRLLSEARAVASLKHPNVIPVFDVGEADGRVFIAMELVDGVTLDRWRALTKPNLERLLEIILQAGQGLAAAHAQGLVHRDFKPQNVLVSTDERVLVTDFGLAVSVGEMGREVAGTPAYMAPEQRTGSASAASDQYSFGLCLAEALGAPLLVNGGEPPALPASVPDWLRVVVQRALHPLPSERYPNLNALLADLQGGTGVTASAHVTANAILLWGWTLLHGFWMLVLLYAALMVWRDPGMLSPEASTFDRLSSVAVPDTLGVAGAASSDPLTLSDGLVMAFAIFGLTWAPLGLLWAPLNALGLWRRKAWARVSTLLYAGFTGFSVLGLPYTGYAIYSLTRPEVVRLFSTVTPTPKAAQKRRLSGSVVQGQVHLTINALVQVGMALLHLGMFALSVELLRFGAEDSSPDTPLIVVIGLILHGLCSVWAPLNAWGLHRRASWARWSSLAYASAAFFTGVGAPYTLYAWISLNLRSVRGRLG